MPGPRSVRRDWSALSTDPRRSPHPESCSSAFLPTPIVPLPGAICSATGTAELRMCFCGPRCVHRVILPDRRVHGLRFTAPIVKDRCCQPCFNPSFGPQNGPVPILRSDSSPSRSKSSQIVKEQVDPLHRSFRSRLREARMGFDEGQVSPNSGTGLPRCRRWRWPCRSAGRGRRRSVGEPRGTRPPAGDQRRSQMPRR